jgi:nitrilase
MMKNHALTGQCWVIYASNTIDQLCLDWMEAKLGKQEFVKVGGGVSGIIHPFNMHLAGPHKGLEQKLVIGEIDLSQLGIVKVWIDSVGHYSRPEVLQNHVNHTQIWPDEKNIACPMKNAPSADGKPFTPEEASSSANEHKKD